jgi:hypothetical protein
MLFMALYGVAWLLVLLYVRISRRSVGHTRSHVKMSMAPRAYKIMLRLLDLLVFLAAIALFALLFFVLWPWWIALGATLGTLVATSLVSGVVTAILIQRFDAAELRLVVGLLLGLMVLAACAWVWRHLAWGNGLFS